MNEQKTDTTTKPGKKSALTITERAAKEVQHVIEENQFSADNTWVRIGAKGGGCSGLSYIREFDEPKEGDTVIDFGGFSVLLDRKSTIYLSGIQLDFQGGLQGKGWVFVNPSAANTCGCGESF